MERSQTEKPNQFTNLTAKHWSTYSRQLNKILSIYKIGQLFTISKAFFFSPGIRYTKLIQNWKQQLFKQSP